MLWVSSIWRGSRPSLLLRGSAGARLLSTEQGVEEVQTLSAAAQRGASLLREGDAPALSMLDMMKSTNVDDLVPSLPARNHQRKSGSGAGVAGDANKQKSHSKQRVRHTGDSKSARGGSKWGREGSNASRGHREEMGNRSRRGGDNTPQRRSNSATSMLLRSLQLAQQEAYQAKKKVNHAQLEAQNRSEFIHSMRLMEEQHRKFREDVKRMEDFFSTELENFPSNSPMHKYVSMIRRTPLDVDQKLELLASIRRRLYGDEGHEFVSSKYNNILTCHDSLLALTSTDRGKAPVAPKTSSTTS